MHTHALPHIQKPTIQTNYWICLHLQLEKELTYENFVKWTLPYTMGKQEVQLGLPRFKMEESYDMKDVLISMGMVDAFDMRMSDFSGRTWTIYQMSWSSFKHQETINLIWLLSTKRILRFSQVSVSSILEMYSVPHFFLTGMSPSNELVLSKVVHKAFVEVNEVGTEAAAATVAMMTLGCCRTPPAVFLADHPFLFFIRHKPSESLLFAGRFCSPQWALHCWAFEKHCSRVWSHLQFPSYISSIRWWWEYCDESIFADRCVLGGYT